jgi:decaprenylphospho-beta-D-erythro-pentofuranosid-2-ulose 2-reductase
VNDSLGMPQTAVVLGGTSDIGRAIVRALALRRLTHVVLAGRDEAGLEANAKELQSLGVPSVETVGWEANTSNHGEVAAHVAALLGGIDLLLVAAGMLGDEERSESDPQAAEEVLRTTFTGPAAAMTAFAEVMRSQGHGRLVVLSSVAGVRIRRSNFVYGSAKAGLDGFAQGLAEALRPHGVRVTIVRPGWVATSMTSGRTPAPMATTPDAVAADVVRGLELGSSVVWSPASLKFVFAIMRLVPAAIWRRLPG